MTSRLILAALTATPFLLSACVQPVVSDDPNANAKRSAAIGAFGGALLGLSSDDDKLEKAAVGAAILGGAGYLLGQKLDQQAADLRADLGNDQVKIVNTGSELIVTMPQDILFATDSAVVQPGLQSDLMALAYNLRDYPDTTVQVVGHTDNTGSATYNQELSTRRASSVATILTANGVAPGRVQAYGRGEDAPVATNLTPEGRALNRRVDIIITPVT